MRGRFDAFDGLRAIAVLLVLGNHLDRTAFQGGWLGVDIFFCLSGYLITYLLLREWEHKDTIVLRRFYARRVLRLMPALFATVVLTAVVVGLAVHGSALKEGAAALAYLTDITEPAGVTHGTYFGHTWSLAVEEQFYLVWPTTLLLCRKRGWNPVPVLAGAVAVGVALTAALVAGGENVNGAYRAPLTHVPCLAAGVFMALAPNLIRRLRFLPATVPVALVLVGVGCAYLNEQQRWLFYGGMLVVSIPIAALVADLVTHPEGQLARLLSIRPLVWLGLRSYGFYLWQYPVIQITRHWAHSALEVALIATPTTFAVTVLSWNLVEQPFLRLKEKFEAGRAQQPVTLSS